MVEEEMCKFTIVVITLESIRIKVSLQLGVCGSLCHCSYKGPKKVGLHSSYSSVVRKSFLTSMIFPLFLTEN